MFEESCAQSWPESEWSKPKSIKRMRLTSFTLELQWMKQQWNGRERGFLIVNNIKDDQWLYKQLIHCSWKNRKPDHRSQGHASLHETVLYPNFDCSLMERPFQINTADSQHKGKTYDWGLIFSSQENTWWLGVVIKYELYGIIGEWKRNTIVWAVLFTGREPISWSEALVYFVWKDLAVEQILNSHCMASYPIFSNKDFSIKNLLCSYQNKNIFFLAGTI